MSNLIDKHPAPNPHFLIVQGETLPDLEEIGISALTIVERVSVADKRLWDYKKIVVPDQENFNKVKLLLQEHQVTILCIDCPDYLEICLADATATEGDEQST